jgi:hypothetical protein
MTMMEDNTLDLSSSQDSQFTQRHLPCGQKRLHSESRDERMLGGRNPINDKEMLVALATIKHDSVIGTVINAIKTSDNFAQNCKNLGSTTKENLKITYSFLAGKEEGDSMVNSLKVEGLKVMIMHQLSTMMPRTCQE